MNATDIAPVTRAMDRRERAERAAVRRVVRALLGAGLRISVNDGEAFPVKRSTSEREIMAGCFSTGMDSLVCRNAEGVYQGSVLLVYGNSPEEVVCDYSVSLEAIVGPATE